MTKRTYTLTFNGIVLDTTNLRMDKKGGQEVIDYFYLDENYSIKDEEIVDTESFRAAIKKSDECEILEEKENVTTLKVTLDLYETSIEYQDIRLGLIEDIANEIGAFSLHDIYRTIYRHCDCGPSIGFEINGKFVYCDSLSDIPLCEYQDKVTGVSISSIVEGSDAEVPPIVLRFGSTKEDFFKALDEVNQEACYLWERDNSDWFMLRSPRGKTYYCHSTWGEVKWDGKQPSKKTKEVVEKFLQENGNMTWEECFGYQTYANGQWFDIEDAPGWSMSQYEPIE